MIKNLQGLDLGWRTLFHVPHRNPTMVQVNITNRCNMVCPMCPREVLDLPQNDLPVEKALRIIDRLDGARKLALVGLGEPLLHPDLDRMIEYAEARGIQTQITTNGLLLLDKNRIRQLVNTGLHDLAFSLESLDGISSFGHQNRAITEIVERSIRIRNEMGRKEPQVTVQIALLSEVLERLDEIVEWANRAGVDHINITRVNALLIPNLRRPGLAEEKNFFKKLRVLRKKYPLRIDCFQDQIFPGLLGFLYREILPLARLEKWCIKWSYYMYIDVHGDIFPCSGLFPKEKALGNIFQDKISDVWNGPGFRALRVSRARRIPCRFCDNLRLRQRVSPGYQKLRELLKESVAK